MKYLILGGGPAGLTLANALLDRNETGFVLLERESVPGGLCRSAMADGAPIDVGGGHFLDVRRPAVNAYLFQFMPESEWNQFDRDSRIRIYGREIHHPYEANIWELPEELRESCLRSIAAAGCNTGSPEPERFTEWITWKLGEMIARDYMLPYNRKMFGDDLDALGTYWLDKLPGVSYEQTLRSCREHRPFGSQPGHSRFYYPKEFGYGELWRRMGVRLGDHLVPGQKVTEIDFSDGSVLTSEGLRLQAETIVTTVPWTSFIRIHGMPGELAASLRLLRHSSVQIAFHPEAPDTDAQWVYVPDPAVPHHRILVRPSFSRGGGFWTETRAERIPESDRGRIRFINEYAYPLNTIGKPAIMSKLLGFALERNVIGLGRWGEHQHYNSDLVVELALTCAERLTGGKGGADPCV